MIENATTPVLVGYRLLPAATGSNELDVQEPDAIDAVDEGGRAVSLVRYADAAGAGRAVRAMTIAAGPHVQSVLDVGTAPNGDVVLVTPQLPNSLDAVAAARAPTPGEAVTVLVPMIEALERMHRTGVAHGAVSGASIRFDASGSPTLAGFDRSVARRGPADAVDERFDAAVASDRAALAALSSRMLRPLGGGEIADRLARWNSDADEIVDALFAWANPSPIGMDAAGAPRDGVASNASSAADAVSRGTAGIPSRVIPAAAAIPDVGETTIPPHRPRGALRLDTTVLASGLRRVHTGLRQVRRRVWAASAASVLLLIAAVVLLPGHGADAATRPPSVIAGAPGTPQRSAPPTSQTTAAPSVDIGAADDPLRAFGALRTARARCLASGRPTCLDAVDSPASPVAQQDADAISAGVAAVAVPSAHLELREKSGSTATIAVGDVTVLLLRNRGLWRFRDVIGAPR